jgi:NitT/TauT family transport system permease protein
MTIEAGYANASVRRLLAVPAVSLTLTIIALLILWELTVRGLNVPKYILPPPSAVFTVTLSEVVCGFVIAAVLGLALGSAVALLPVFDKTIYPLILAMQTVPKIALAPLFLIWFGYGIQSKIITAALIALFPILVNVVAGMRAMDQRRILLMRSIGASAVSVFFKA